MIYNVKLIKKHVTSSYFRSQRVHFQFFYKSPKNNRDDFLYNDKLSDNTVILTSTYAIQINFQIFFEHNLLSLILLIFVTESRNGKINIFSIIHTNLCCCHLAKLLY